MFLYAHTYVTSEISIDRNLLKYGSNVNNIFIAPYFHMHTLMFHQRLELMGIY